MLSTENPSALARAQRMSLPCLVSASFRGLVPLTDGAQHDVLERTWGSEGRGEIRVLGH